MSAGLYLFLSLAAVSVFSCWPVNYVLLESNKPNNTKSSLQNSTFERLTSFCAMNDIKRLKEEQREKHPGFDSYLNCMTRSLFGGLATFWLTFSGLYFTQKVVQRKIRYPLKFNILVSALTASGVAYYTTRSSTLRCQTNWVEFEGKSGITPKHQESN